MYSIHAYKIPLTDDKLQHTPFLVVNNIFRERDSSF